MSTWLMKHSGYINNIECWKFHGTGFILLRHSEYSAVFVTGVNSRYRIDSGVDLHIETLLLHSATYAVKSHRL